jgi:hypothetical protein
MVSKGTLVEEAVEPNEDMVLEMSSSRSKPSKWNAHLNLDCSVDNLLWHRTILRDCSTLASPTSIEDMDVFEGHCLLHYPSFDCLASELDTPNLLSPVEGTMSWCLSEDPTNMISPCTETTMMESINNNWSCNQELSNPLMHTALEVTKDQEESYHVLSAPIEPWISFSKPLKTPDLSESIENETLLPMKCINPQNLHIHDHTLLTLSSIEEVRTNHLDLYYRLMTLMPFRLFYLLKYPTHSIADLQKDPLFNHKANINMLFKHETTSTRKSADFSILENSCYTVISDLVEWIKDPCLIHDMCTCDTSYIYIHHIEALKELLNSHCRDDLSFFKSICGGMFRYESYNPNTFKRIRPGRIQTRSNGPSKILRLFREVYYNPSTVIPDYLFSPASESALIQYLLFNGLFRSSRSHRKSIGSQKLDTNDTADASAKHHSTDGRRASSGTIAPKKTYRNRPKRSVSYPVTPR